ncbi:Pentatricopeptide repeat [Arabidopsis thaliana x Arabidopsis arenosa]|uniref:Pentatricopeptide repeat n=1 Tax=Arabidopsis thaliana x Arabidopsis arenosa TaxID=1240361 RepID=A0A8T1Y419_9BRAS|nr:Pentatricopeptide repeat [Arabidopsis thaliana x Arabidopsis arenosa]
MWFFSVCNRLNNGVNLLFCIQRKTLSREYGSSMGRFGLYKRISPLGDPKISIFPVLDQWRGEGNYTSKEELRGMIKELIKYKRFVHALEVSRWMSDRMFFPLSLTDFGTRINLISRVCGLGEAEVFFENIPKDMKGIAVFSSLLSCYARKQSAEKAAKLVEAMKEAGVSMDTRCYNLMMNMYYQMNVHGKLDDLMLEMEQNGIAEEAFHTLLKLYGETGRKEDLSRVWLRFKEERKVFNSGYKIMISSALKFGDIELVEKVFNQWESEKLSYDFRIPNLLINCYCEKGLTEKAELLLKKAEGNRVSPPMDAYICLANIYLEGDEISKATEAIERAVSTQIDTDQRLEAQRELLNSCLACLRGNGDGRKRFGEVMDSLTSENLFSIAALERLSHHLSQVRENNILSC